MNSRGNRRFDFILGIMKCIVSPQSLFKSVLEKPNLTKATSLILVIAVVAAWASFNYMSKLPLTSLLQQEGGGMFPEQGQLMIASVVMTLIGVFGTWFTSSALIHGFAKVLKGNGAFNNILILAGYASMPLLIQQLLRLVDSFVVSPEGALQIVGFLVSAGPLLNPIASAAAHILTIFRLWSIVLLVIAVRENYKVSMARSTVVTILSFTAVLFISTFLPLM